MSNFTSTPWMANDKGQVFAGGVFVCSVAFPRQMPDTNAERQPGESWLDAYARLESVREEIDAEMVGRARLIAAAPELLSALQAIMDETGGYVPDTAKAVWAAAHAAIQKATGGEP